MKTSNSGLKKRPKVDIVWFKNQFASRDLTQRKVCKLIGINPTGLTLFLQGKRNLKNSYIVKLAETLGITIEDVLTHAGVPVHSGGAKESVGVVGYVDANFSVTFGPAKGPKAVPKPSFGGTEISAIRFQTAGTPLSGIDGACAYFHKSEGKITNELAGKYAIVKITGSKKWLLRVCNRGYRGGTWNLNLMNGTLKEEDVSLEAAMPVIWLRF
jgi:hypothetical protein